MTLAGGEAWIFTGKPRHNVPMNIFRACALSLLCVVGIVSAQSTAKTKTLTHEELTQALDLKKNLFFLDVRDPKEIEESGSIKGYVNIPVKQLESRLSEVPKDKQIVTACAHGRRAGVAAEILVKNGYNVLGACGLADWKEKRHPLVFPEKKQ
jgi:rhodanese-related sulfurtransferase